MKFIFFKNVYARLNVVIDMSEYYIMSNLSYYRDFQYWHGKYRHVLLKVYLRSISQLIRTLVMFKKVLIGHKEMR